MHRASVLLLLVVASLALSCGTGSGRQLQSITITQAANGQQIDFVATGHFSSPPITVTPIPVEWSIQLMAPPPPQYSLTTQPFMLGCPSSSGLYPIVAYAPSDANAPLNGSWSTNMISSAGATVTCP
jgi:hypothetical protein